MTVIVNRLSLQDYIDMWEKLRSKNAKSDMINRPGSTDGVWVSCISPCARLSLACFQPLFVAVCLCLHMQCTCSQDFHSLSVRLDTCFPLSVFLALKRHGRYVCQCENQNAGTHSLRRVSLSHCPVSDHVLDSSIDAICSWRICSSKTTSTISSRRCKR